MPCPPTHEFTEATKHRSDPIYRVVWTNARVHRSHEEQASKKAMEKYVTLVHTTR